MKIHEKIKGLMQNFVGLVISLFMHLIFALAFIGIVILCSRDDEAPSHNALITGILMILPMIIFIVIVAMSSKKSEKVTNIIDNTKKQLVDTLLTKQNKGKTLGSISKRKQ